jgi:hypothetical protein
MTLARKGTRRIQVDGIVYRWTVAPDDEPGVAIVVENAAEPARRLVSWVDHGVAIGPGLVRHAILAGLCAGWISSERGPDFVLRGNKVMEPKGR